MRLRYLSRFAFLLTFSIFVSCETSPPVSSDQPAIYQDLIVLSNIDSSSIFIDGVFTGRYTPDTLSLAIGNYLVRLEKENYAPSEQTVTLSKDTPSTLTFSLMLQTAQKIVLIEDFANISCQPCVSSNMIIENLTRNVYGFSKIVAVKYSTNFPAPNDPFYLANKNNNDARMSYYSILFAPSTYIDGVKATSSTDENEIIAKIDNALTEIPKFKIDPAFTIAGQNILTGVTVTVIDLSGISMSELVLHTVITESDIHYNAPNGETVFYDVTRTMLPSNSGTDLSAVSAAGIYEFNNNVSVGSGWDISKIAVIAFIQNKNTKKILQTGSTFN